MKAASLNRPNSRTSTIWQEMKALRPLIISGLALILVCFLAGLAVGYQWGKSSAPLQPIQSQSVVQQAAPLLPPTDGLRDDVVNYATTFLGTPYRTRGEGNDGFDCSGFIAHVYKNFKIDLPPSTRHLIKQGREVTESEAQPGDLIFFTGTSKDSREVGHVGIVVANKGDDIKFIHSSSASTTPYVKYDSLTRPNYRRRFLLVKQILPE